MQEGNITEVCKLMSGEKIQNRVDYSPSHQTQVLTPIHMELVRVSIKTNMTLHQQVICVVALLQK